jgi:ABC-type hemin transport system ATPase subunit
MILTVHDELLFEAPAADADRVAELVRATMAEGVSAVSTEFENVPAAQPVTQLVASVEPGAEVNPGEHWLHRDEFAADQDPEFRRFFYETLLPELKAAGKTVIAITHDDRYFHCADRVIKMEYGQVQSTAPTSNPPDL